MATETLIFMPNGDVTLTLTRYILKEDENTPRNTSDLSKAPTQPAINDDGLLESATDVEAELEALAAEEESVLFFAPDPPEIPNGPSSPPPPRARRGSNASSRRDRSESPPASFWATLKRQAARVAEPEQNLTPPPAEKHERVVLSSHEVQCVVSSRHLMLASRYFLTILSGEFPQAMTLRTQGHVTIPLQDDLDSMIILLNVIHGAGRKVPRQVSLDVLSKLAVLVSRYEMLSTVEFFSDTWIDNLQRGGLPKMYNENVLPLVFVFWVFDRPDEFRDMTRLAQRESTEKLEDDVGDMPILHGIIDAIKRDREFAIETAITVVQALIDRYMAGQAICDSALDDELRYACDSMVLGCLMTSSRKIGIWPKPTAPFNGKKFKDLVKAIRSIRILDVCNKTSSRRWNSHGPSSNCHGLEDSIEASMKSIEAGLDGLKLEDFPKETEDYTSILQASLPAPLVDIEKEQPREDITEDFRVYMKENFTEPLLKEVKPILQEFSVPSPHFSPRIDSSKMTEYPRQEFFSAPSPPFSPHHGSPTIADSPKEEFSGASSYFSKRLDSQMLAASPREQLSTQLPRSSPPIQAPTPVQVVQQEIPAPPSYFSPQFNSPKAADPPVQAPSPRFSPPIKSPPVVQSPKPEAPAPSPPILARTNTNPFRPAESQSPKQEFSAVSPRFSPQMNAPKVSTAPKQQVQSNGNTRNGFSGFMQNEIEVAPRDFSVPSPRFTPSPRLESPKMAESPKQSKQMTETSTNGSRGSLKEEKKTETRGVDESMQEGVKVAPRPFSHQIHQSIVSISPRSSTLEVQPPAEEEPNRISTNSPPPTQKFRMLANSKTTAQTSDSEQSTRDEIQRAPSVISNLSIDEMLMDIPQPQPVKEVRQSVVEVKGKEAKTTGISNGNGNGNGNASQTTTEAEDAWTPPKNFKMKKTKKTFSTRY